MNKNRNIFLTIDISQFLALYTPYSQMADTQEKTGA